MNRGLSADGKHAFVLGGSMAGLLASRVLTDQFERVSLIERDSLPELAGQRRGVPQGWHSHGLLADGRNVLEKLFLGISETRLEAGVVSGCSRTRTLSGATNWLRTSWWLTESRGE